MDGLCDAMDTQLNAKGWPMSRKMFIIIDTDNEAASTARSLKELLKMPVPEIEDFTWLDGLCESHEFGSIQCYELFFDGEEPRNAMDDLLEAAADLYLAGCEWFENYNCEMEAACPGWMKKTIAYENYQEIEQGLLDEEVGATYKQVGDEVFRSVKGKLQ